MPVKRPDSVNIQRSGTNLGEATGIDFTGAGVSVTLSASRAQVSIAAGGAGGSVTSDELSAGDAALSVRIDTVSNQVSVLSQAVSVISQQVSVLSQTVSAGDAGLSVRIDTQSQGISVLSQQVSVLSQALSVVSNAASNALSVANAASNAASIVSQALSVAEAALSARINTQSQGISVLSQQVSVLSQAVSVADAALSVRINTQSQGISVLSQQVSVLSQANSAAHVSIMLAVSGESAARAAADTSLAGRVDSVAGKSLGGISGVSIGVLSDTQVLKWDSVQGQWINATDATGGAGGSVTSTELSAVSAAAASNIASVLSVANAASNAASIVSQAVSIVSVNAASALSIANAASAAAAAVSAAHTSLVSDVARISVNVSAISTAVSVLSNLFSTLRGGSAGAVLQKSGAGDFAWVWSTIAAGAGSVTSTELSARAPSLAASLYVTNGTQSIATSTANTNISGLSFAVGANQTWQFEGVLMVSTSATTVGMKLGASVPPLSSPKFMWARGQSFDDQGSLAVSANSAPISMLSVVAGLGFLEIRAIMNTTSSGVVQFTGAAIASATASPLHIISGSYMKAFRIK